MSVYINRWDYDKIVRSTVYARDDDAPQFDDLQIYGSALNYSFRYYAGRVLQ
jgi:hypothetical protein